MPTYDPAIHADAPPPGMYLDVPFHAYLRWPYLSKSALTDFVLSPALHAARVRGELPYRPSDSQVIGSAVDAMWVEGLDLCPRDGWQIVPRWVSGAKLPATGKKRQSWIDALPYGVRPISVALAHRAIGMADALESNERATALRSGAMTQVSLVWDDPLTGLRMSGRPDLVDFERKIVIDLKTAQDVRYRQFCEAARRYRYHWQLALYTRALSVLGYGDACEWQQWIVAVRNAPPYGVACRPYSAAAIETAWRQLDRVLARYRECALAQHWPADHDDETPLTVDY